VEQQLADLGVVRARLRSLLALCEDGDADCLTLDSPVLRDGPGTGLERPCCR
jgi:hypothetical protein